MYDPDRRAAIPDHVLGTFVAKLTSLIERKDQVVEAEFSLLDEVENLPPDRAVELLQQEIVRLDQLSEMYAVNLRELLMRHQPAALIETGGVNGD